MTVPAEVPSSYPIRAGIEICMAVVTRRPRVGMPLAILTAHVPCRMCPWIGAPNPVRIEVACDTGRVHPLHIVAADAALDITTGVLGMTTTA